jgi:arsenate reductase (thioredoxin)
VITVCDSAKDSCPIFPGAPRRLRLSFPDPAPVEGDEEERLEALKRVRDGLSTTLAELGGGLTR